ncbi:MAG: MATE family efflux transporter [Alphaproteobacteria bacterium]|nr:MATE family efflux transporter [Alphaproteobacteria bacterium]
MIYNLTKGYPAKLITIFCLPLFIGNLIQQLYSITDILIVGRLLGVNALAAVGATAPIFFVCLLLSFGFTNGLNVVTAQCFGASDFNNMRKSVTHAIMASFVLCCCMTVFLICFLKPVLHLMNVPTEIEHDAYLFMSILSAGLVMIVFYNLTAGFMRAVGDSRTPLYFLIFSTALNIAFNFIFIYFFGLGVKGSALGTVLAATIAFISCGLFMHFKFKIMRLTKADWKFDKNILIKQLNIALPMSVQFSVLSISMMVIQSACNSFGPEVIAAFTAALRIEQLGTQPMLALGMAMATYSAQNFGAKKIARIRQGVRFTILVSFIAAILMSLCVRYIGRDMISVFLSNYNPFIMDVGKKYLGISTPFYFFLGLIFIFRNTLQGMGKVWLPLLASLTELFIRSFAALILASAMGYQGIFYASPAAWVSASLVVVIGYIFSIHAFKKKLKKQSL